MGYFDKQPSCRPITYWNWIIPAEVRKQRRRSANNCKGKRIYDSSTDDDVQRPRNRTDVRFRHKVDIGRTSAECLLLTQSGHGERDVRYWGKAGVHRHRNPIALRPWACFEALALFFAMKETSGRLLGTYRQMGKRDHPPWATDVACLS